MRKTIVLFLVFCRLIMSTIAQEETTPVKIEDVKGNELFGGKYRNATRFSEGLCSVAVATNEPCKAGNRDEDLPPCNLQWSVIDTTGRVVIDNMEIWGFKEGIGIVTLDKNEYMFIDSTGKRLFERNFYKADSFSEGLAFVIEMDKTSGFINHQGVMVIRLPKGYRTYASTKFRHGVATIYKLACHTILNRLSCCTDPLDTWIKVR